MDFAREQAGCTADTDWQAHLAAQAFLRRAEPVDFRRWKSASPRFLRTLHPAANVHVLDATAGLGEHTVNLVEAGFAVDGCDASSLAVAETQKACEAAGVSARVFRARWESLASEYADRYDLIFHDSLHWIDDENVLHQTLRSFHTCLRPGGALVFFFADARMPNDNAGAKIFAWDAKALPAEEILWEAEVDGVRKTCVRLNRLHPVHTPHDGASKIEQRHLILTHGSTTIESYTLWRIYRWDFAAMSRVLRLAGFSDIRSDIFQNDHGHSVALNRAFR